MKRSSILACLTAVVVVTTGSLLFTGPAMSQNTGAATGARKTWKVTHPGGEYSVDVDAMTSVSLHSFRIEGDYRVWEVAVSDTSSQQVRFYWVSPTSANENAPEASTSSTKDDVKAKTTGGKDEDEWKKVMKQYPQATHAHTVEYRVDKLSILSDIYNSAKTSFDGRTAGALFISKPRLSESASNSH